tara:strand:- start:125 stop:733 length:609 start_codon:yes stop_codon:yes gene_type:complete
MKQTILILLFTLICFNANADKSINDWSGLYLGVYQSEDNLSESATSTLYPGSPYSGSTDENIYNTGNFVGYNYSINNLIVGIEAGYQDNVGTDEAITGFDGYAVYDDMQEYKLKIGYSLDKYLVYTFFGTGDMNVYWSAYTNEDHSTNDFKIKGIGLSGKITNNIFVGLSYSETNLEFYYPDTAYTEVVQLDSLRLRFGYLF